MSDVCDSRVRLVGVVRQQRTFSPGVRTLVALPIDLRRVEGRWRHPATRLPLTCCKLVGWLMKHSLTSRCVNVNDGLAVCSPRKNDTNAGTLPIRYDWWTIRTRSTHDR